MCCNDFFYSYKYAIWKSSYFLPAKKKTKKQQKPKNKLSFNFSFFCATAIKKSSLTQYMLYGRSISHTNMPYGQQMIATTVAIKVGVTAAMSL